MGLLTVSKIYRFQTLMKLIARINILVGLILVLVVDLLILPRGKGLIPA